MSLKHVLALAVLSALTTACGEGTVLSSSPLGMASVTWALPEDVGTHRLRFFAVQLNGDTVEGFATAEAEVTDF